MQTRKTLLEQLLRFEKPLQETLSLLESFDLDSDGSLAFLGYADIAHVLERYLQGVLSRRDVYDWAAALELREDIEFGHDEEHVFDIIYKLATPELEGELTPARAQNLLQLFSAANTPRAEEIDTAYA